MTYKKIYILIFILLNNCTIQSLESPSIKSNIKSSFINKGFTLIYSDQLFEEKQISKKIDNRSLIIFQKNLKKGTFVKIVNILNNKYTIAEVGSNSLYPSFNNSVISQRIASEIDLDENEPYIEINEILNNSSFVAKKALTFDEEKNVANKAPISDINIVNLGNNTEKIIKIKKKDFNYTIKIADFYFKKTAIVLKKRILNETSINNVKIKKISNTKFRVFLGDFYNINSLQKAVNDINILDFENIEILKND